MIIFLFQTNERSNVVNAGTIRYNAAISPPTPCHQLKMLSHSRKILTLFQYIWHFPATTKQ